MIAVSFLPVLTLEAQEGRIFKPLAYTKTLAMVVAAVLAITLDPALRLLLTNLKNFNFRPHWLCTSCQRGACRQDPPGRAHPVSRLLMRLYDPVAAGRCAGSGVVVGGRFDLGHCDNTHVS